jgi:8-oxo-dGTP pyrophosphatase MutT (NUDIX family)
MPAVARKAATIILLREKAPKGFEVLLLKRHEKSNFFAGNYVYPGGGLEPQDCVPDIHPFCRGLSPGEASTILGGSAPPDESLGYWVAAVRELFEEAGILLAYGRKGSDCRTELLTDPAKLSGYRTSLQNRKITIQEMTQVEGLSLALDQVIYYAHWITPEARSVRFDTRFFLARHPEGQEANHDRQETTARAWISPAKALEANLQGEIILSPPTLKTLEDLSLFQSIQDLLPRAREARKLPILPILTKVPEGPLLVFPWDPEYETFKRGEIPSPLDHGHPASLGDNSTRLLLKDGRWHPYCVGNIGLQQSK